MVRDLRGGDGGGGGCVHRRRSSRRVHRRVRRRDRRTTTAAAAAESGAAASTAAVATTAALTGNFFVVSARVALLFVAFKSVLQHFIVVAPPGFGWNPVPNRPGGHPNPGAHTRLAPDPARAHVEGAAAVLVGAVAAARDLYQTAPAARDLNVAPAAPAPTPGGHPSACADPAFTCVGECGLCIYFPGRRTRTAAATLIARPSATAAEILDACCPAGTVRRQTRVRRECAREKVGLLGGQAGIVFRWGPDGLWKPFRWRPDGLWKPIRRDRTRREAAHSWRRGGTRCRRGGRDRRGRGGGRRREGTRG